MTLPKRFNVDYDEAVSITIFVYKYNTYIHIQSALYKRLSDFRPSFICDFKYVCIHTYKRLRNFFNILDVGLPGFKLITLE